MHYRFNACFLAAVLLLNFFTGCVDDTEEEHVEWFNCNDGWQRIHPQYVQDGKEDCDDGSDEIPDEVVCNDDKPTFIREQENIVVDYVYGYSYGAWQDSWNLHLTDNGSWADGPTPATATIEMNWNDRPSIAGVVVESFDGVCDFEILDTLDTGKCVDYATSITYVKVSYNIQYRGQKYDVSEVKQDFSVAKSRDNGQWGVFPEGNFPITYDCNFEFQGISDHEIDSDNDRLDDVSETKIYGTNSTNNDTDDDGLSDYDEIFVYFTNPLEKDSDNDGLSDYFEIKRPDIYNDFSMPLLLHYGPIGYWPLDNSNGSTVIDKSKNNNTGYWKGGFSSSEWTKGKRGNAIELDGVDDYIHVKHNSVFNTTGELSVSAWINPDIIPMETGVTQVIASNFLSATNDWEENKGFSFKIEGYGRLSFTYGYGATETCQSEKKLSENEWSLVTITKSRNSLDSVTFIDLYINDILDTTCSFTSPKMINSANYFSIGASDYDGDGSAQYYFNGIIDEIALWDRKLASNEIVEFYNPDVQQRIFGLNPLLPDTDRDGLTDGQEHNLLGTNPLDNLSDIDSDGIPDNVELLVHYTDINNDDTDMDGLTDWEEINLYFTDPLSSDTDGDDLSDFFEINHTLDYELYLHTLQGNAAIRDHYPGSYFPKNIILEEGGENGYSGALSGSAAYEFGENSVLAIVLTEAETLLDGQITYELDLNPQEFIIEFDFYAGNGTGADAIWFFAFCNTVGQSEDSNCEGGYHFVFNELYNRIEIFHNGSEIYEKSISPINWDIDDAQWHHARIEFVSLDFYENKKLNWFNIYVDNALEVKFYDSHKGGEGDLFGFGGRTGGATNRHLVRNFDMYTGLGEVSEFTLNPRLTDSDGDGLNDSHEFILDTNPLLIDSDGNGVNDGEEHYIGQEQDFTDSDMDGLSDENELFVYNTNISNPDTDGDGLSDGDEINLYFTDSLNFDSDGDGLSDLFEIKGEGEESLILSSLNLKDIDYHWLFDEKTNTVVFDSGTKNNHGTLLNGPIRVKGLHPIYGGALQFDGVNDIVQIPNNPLLNIPSGTVSLWMNPNSIDNNNENAQVLIGSFSESDFNDGARTPTIAITKNGNLMWEFCDSFDNEINFNLEEGVWYHIVLSWKIPADINSRLVELYINGVLEDSILVESNCQSHWNNSLLQIGAYNYDGALNSFFNGSIDDFLIWNRSLSNEEITEIYDSYIYFKESFLNPTNFDTDLDGISDKDEVILLGSNPFSSIADLDNDGIIDNIEFFIYQTDLSNNDTDGDGIDDYSEIYTFLSNPLTNDTDGDGLSDGIELKKCYYLFELYGSVDGQCMWRQTGGCVYNGNREPSNDRACNEQISTGWSGYCDCNGNNIFDGFDVGYGCSTTPGTCQDICLPHEYSTDSEQLSVDSKNFNLLIISDADGDGLSDGEEFALGTDASNYDTDGDGLSDGMELILYNTNATNFDSDNDGASDFDEITAYGTDPNQNDNPVVFLKESLLETKDWFKIEDFYSADRDGDGVIDKWDNCPDKDNWDQWDYDGDGIGDACPPSPATSGGSGGSSGGYNSALECGNAGNPVTYIGDTIINPDTGLWAEVYVCDGRDYYFYYYK